MALPVIVPRNQVQRSNKRALFQQDTASHPITYYTCPANKIAIITGTWQCLDTGAAAVVDLNINAISIAEVQATGGGTDPSVPQDLAEGLLFPFKVTLAATDTFNTSQDSGTNANTEIIAEIEEFPI